MSLEERPSIGERYSAAISSPNLRATPTACDTDVLIAAAWCSAELGSSLHRLRTEFDRVKGEVSGQGANQLVDRLLILSSLPSLESVKSDLGRFAVQQATVHAFMKPDAVVLRLVGRALDLFLDPNCYRCEGRGKSGGYGLPEMLCKHCDGGKRTFKLAGQDEADRSFVQMLLSSMEAKCAQAESSMRHLLQSPA